MIDVKQIGKPKTNTGNGGGSTTVVSVSKVAEEAGYASRAGRADKAAYADISNYATTSAQSTRANYASVAGELSEDSDVYDKFIRKDIDDSAKGVITFLKGLLLGDGTHGITEEGAATLASVISEKWKITQEGVATLKSILSDNWSIGEDGAAILASALAGTFATKAYTGADMHGQGAGMYDESGLGHVVTDYLTVRIKAIFSELEIRKLSYVGGNYIFSHAGSQITTDAELEGMTVDGVAIKAVEQVENGYKVRFKADDGTTRTQNMWRVGDMALCQTFNIKSGSYKNVSNRYYWRLVVGTGTETATATKTVTGSDGTTSTATEERAVDYIVLSDTATISGALSDGDDKIYAVGWDGKTDATSVFAGVDPCTRTNMVGTSSSSYEAYRTAAATASTLSLSALANDAPEGGDTLVQVGYQGDYRVTTSGATESGLCKERGGVVEIVTEGIGDEACPAINVYSAINDYRWSAHKTIQISADGIDLRAKYFRQMTDSGAGEPYTVFNYRGAWSSVNAYTYGDVVTYNGQTWVWGSSTDSTSSNVPGTDAGWQLAASKGSDGTSVTIKGTLSSTDELPTSGNANGDCYIIGGDLFVYTGNGEYGGFTDAGKIKGDDGASVTVSSYKSEYCYADSGTEAPSTGWSETVPQAEPGRYLWSRTTVYYSDGTKTESYNVSYIGKDGESGADAVTYEIDALAEDAVATISAAASGDNITYSGTLNVSCKWNVYKKTGGTRTGSALTGIAFTFAYNNGASTTGLSSTMLTTPDITLTGSGISYSSTDGRTSIAVTFMIGGATIGTRIVPITLKPSSLVTATDDMWSSVVANKKSIAALQVEADSISAKVESITPASKNLLSMSGEGTRVVTGMYNFYFVVFPAEAGKTYTVTWRCRQQYASQYMRCDVMNADGSHYYVGALHNGTAWTVRSMKVTADATETLYARWYDMNSSGGDPGTHPYKSYIDWVRVDEGDLTGNPPTEWEASDLDLEAVNLLPDYKTANSVYSTFTDGMGTRKLVNDNGDITSVITVEDDGDTGDKHIMFVRSSDPGGDNYDGLEWLMPFRGAGTYCLSADFYYHKNLSGGDSTDNRISLVLMVVDKNGTVYWIDSMNEGRSQYNWDYQCGWVSGYVTAAVPATYNGVEVSEIGVKVFMTRAGKMSVKNICVAKCGHATRYDAQELSSAMGVAAKTLATGVDIYSGKILVTTDQFVVRNNSGEVTAKINADGVLETNGGVFNGEVNATSGVFQGTVRASNFYHTVYMPESESSEGYRVRTFRKVSGSWVSLGYLSSEEYQSLIDAEGTGYDPMEWYADGCSGIADIILCGESGGREVTLPRAIDFVGKVVEVYDVAYSSSASDITVGIVQNTTTDVSSGYSTDGVEHFGLGVMVDGGKTYGAPSNQELHKVSIPHETGACAKFVAVKLAKNPGFSDCSQYWWIEMTAVCGAASTQSLESEERAVADETETQSEGDAERSATE